MFISAAGNVVVPAYLTILAKGYTIDTYGDDGALLAAKGENTYVADDPILLLGVIMVGETRGEDWRASDEEIDDYLAKFETADL